VAMDMCVNFEMPREASKPSTAKVVTAVFISLAPRPHKIKNCNTHPALKFLRKKEPTPTPMATLAGTTECPAGVT
jgi:hypothetical protein